MEITFEATGQKTIFEKKKKEKGSK